MQTFTMFLFDVKTRHLLFPALHNGLVATIRLRRKLTKTLSTGCRHVLDSLLMLLRFQFKEIKHICFYKFSKLATKRESLAS